MVMMMTMMNYSMNMQSLTTSEADIFNQRYTLL